MTLLNDLAQTPHTKDHASAPELTELRRLIETIDAAPALTWRARSDGQCEWFSASWLSHTGRALGELVGDGWKRDVHPEDLDRCIGIREASAAAKSIFTLDYRLHHHAKGYRWMLDTGRPLLAADGALLGYVGSSIDIHERYGLEEKLADRTQSLRLAERRQGAFMSMLSHELRNPLAPIANAASVLRTLEAGNPILLRLREILERQVARLSKLVEDLIDVTRSAQGQISLVSERVAVDGMVRAAMALCQEKVAAGRHTVNLQLPEARLFVKGDPARLAQALANLIGNAAKFSIEPGPITIEVSAIEGTVHIAVHDIGRGIAPGFLPHVFDLFTQEDQILARSLGGLGVGLTLARRIGQLHGGDVEGHSDGPGLGSSFVLSLPLLDAEMTDADSDSLDGDSAPLGERYRVLVIESATGAGESLGMQMEMWGNEVSTARNASEALRLTATFKPQIVVCDLGVPGIEAIELLATMRSLVGDASVAFAAVTSHARDGDQARARAAGFDSFLIKPLRSDSLVRLLRSCAARPAG